MPRRLDPSTNVNISRATPLHPASARLRGPRCWVAGGFLDVIIMRKLPGSGYPDGLQGDAISLLAQIIGIIDAYDAVTTRRSYQQAEATDAAVEILRRQVVQGWRRHDLVEEFVAMIRGEGSRSLDGTGIPR